MKFIFQKVIRTPYGNEYPDEFVEVTGKITRDEAWREIRLRKDYGRPIQGRRGCFHSYEFYASHI